MVRPSTYPRASNPRRIEGKASVSGVPTSSTPRRVIFACCASTASGVATAPASEISRKRRRSTLGWWGRRWSGVNVAMNIRSLRHVRLLGFLGESRGDGTAVAVALSEEVTKCLDSSLGRLSVAWPAITGVRTLAITCLRACPIFAGEQPMALETSVTAPAGSSTRPDRGSTPLCVRVRSGFGRAVRQAASPIGSGRNPARFRQDRRSRTDSQVDRV